MVQNSDSYGLLLENMLDAFAHHRIILDDEKKPVDYEFITVNTAFEEMTGLSRDKVLGKKVTEVLPGIQGSKFDWIGTYGKVALTGESIRFEEYSEPLNRWYEVTAYCDKPGYFVTNFHNITNIKLANENLKKNAEQQALLLDNISTQVWYLKDTETYGSVNSAHADFFGVEKKDIENKSLYDILTTEEEARICIAGNQEVFENKQQAHTKEWVINGTGKPRLLSINKTPKLDSSNNVEYVVCSAEDITERIGVEEALRKSEKKYAQAYSLTKGILESSQEVVMFALDRDYRYLAFNANHKATMKQIWGVEIKLGIIMLDYITDPADQRKAKINFDRALKGESFTLIEQYGDTTINRLWYQNVYSPLYDFDGSLIGLTLILTDITRQKKAEALLQESKESLSYQLQFEKMVFNISSYFVSLPSEHLDDGIEHALKQTGEFFQVDRSYVFQFSADRKKMSNTHEWCAEGIEPQKNKLQNIVIDALLWWAKKIRSEEYVYIPDVDMLPLEAEAEKKEFKYQDIQSLLCIPMIRKRECIGFMGFDAVKEKKEWTDDHVVLLKVVGELISNALTRSQVEEEIRRLSFYDSLTGLYNRVYLEQEMQRLDTNRQMPISIVMADLNGLKLVNDTYGHCTGDKMLKSAAEILKQSCREEDLIARWSGDEFVILLSQTSIKEARAICRRIIDSCKKTNVRTVPLSVALGAASKKEKEKDLSETLKVAEDNMYKHKLAESRSTKSAILNALLKTLEEKSYETEEHARRMQETAIKIGTRINLSETELDRLTLLVYLHDIGKITVPEEILTKKRKLTEKDWKHIKKHPETGYRIARSMEEFAHVAEDILLHHEHWNGMGYPKGLKGKEIPLLARIVNIVDAYEVMTNGRPYKEPLCYSEVVAELKRCAGTQFDPELVEVFLSILEEK